jgi:arginyl-tRNA--protein-N-Asp/Glu arginylyltransferase
MKRMESLFSYVAPPSPCSYLRDQTWRLEYEMVQDLTGEEYMRRMLAGWRRFGAMLFRPRCPACTQCRALRVDVANFKPNRSQRRAGNRNKDDVTLKIGLPSVSRAKLNMYDRYHAFKVEERGWPEHPAKDAESYRESFVFNPEFTEEWTYHLGGKLIGVGYVDRLAGGLSAIYFFHDPEYCDRSLGTWNVLSLLDRAAELGLPYLYLGYYVAGCRSMQYKARFAPNEVLLPTGQWQRLRN